MSTTSRRSLYALLAKLGRHRIDKDDGAPAPISLRQTQSLIDGVSWISWSVTPEGPDSRGKCQVRLRPVIDENLSAVHAEPGRVYSNWVYIPAVLVGAALVGLASLGVVGIIIAVVLALGAIGGLVQAAGTSEGLIVLFTAAVGALALLALDARRNRFIRTVRAINAWLRTAEPIVETVPPEWIGALDDPGTHDRVVSWMLSRPEIDSLESHIAHGVKLRKHLSPTDPRRRTMQVEIESRRQKRDALASLRDDQKTIVSEAAEAYLAEQRIELEAERERQNKAREAQQEREEYLRRVQEITTKEQERIKNHEQIDEWFDREP